MAELPNDVSKNVYLLRMEMLQQDCRFANPSENEN